MRFPQKDIDSLVATIEGAGKTIEQQAGDELAALAIYDHAFFDRVRSADGEEKAVELHKKLWLRRVVDSVNEGKEELGFPEIDSIPRLGLMAKAAFERRGCIVEVNDIRPDYFCAEVTRDPLCEFAGPLNGEEIGGVYMNSFAAALEEVIPEMVVQSGMADMAEAKLLSSQFAGDPTTVFTFTKKAGC